MTQQRPSTRATSPAAASLRFAPTLMARSLQAAFAVIAATTVVGAARANPQGGVVVGGQATISQPSPALTTIQQSSQRAVIDWRSFSIGGSEAVRFNQPGPTAATLNRVIGNEPSNILGSLSANGRVYLVNQNGVFIGPNAQLDAAALVLSTANISNSDFMAGKLKFDQPGKPGAKIINEGRITAADGGLVAMVAPGVENRGVISARLGQVVLAGAPAFSLDLFGDGMVNIVLSPQGMGAISDATGRPLTNYVDNSGKVTADGGRIWISAATARGLVDGMVNISGELRATRVAQQGGEITLLGGNSLTVNGNVAATSADGKGGSIAASADAITLASNAVLDASGATGGGTVLVGGGYQGKSAVPGASTTAGSLRVAEGAQVKVDATGASGNGGLAVLWSDNDTRFSGSVSARAGSAGGDGGLMEVSGKKYLAFDGTADGRAAAGAAGTLLLDPGSLTVADAGSGGFSASGADSTVAAGTINNVLRSGTSVALQADDNITINSQIDGRPFVGGFSVKGGNLSLTAGGAVTVDKAIVLNDGSFTSSSGSFTQTGGNVIATLGGKPISITATKDLSTQYLLTDGDLNLVSTAGNIVANQALGLTLGSTPQPLANLSVSAAGSATVTNGIFTRGNTTFGSGSITVGETIVGGILNVAAGSSFRMQGSAQVGAFVAGAPGAPIGAFSMATIPGAPKETQLDAGTGDVSITANSIDSLGTIRSAGGIGLEATGSSITLAKLESTGGGAIDVRSAGSILLPESASILSYGGRVGLNAGGAVQAVGAIAANNLDLTAPPQAGGTINVRAASDVSVRQLVAMGSIDLSSTSGNVTLLQSVGGDNEKQPLVGSLRITAGKDVTTNGLNLAGDSTPGADGLRIVAGTAGAGGKILVNERIGVDAGNLQFGPAAATRNEAYGAVLSQGVYARSGNQNITFNVPVVADGTRINEQWRSLISSPDPAAPLLVSDQLGEKLVDMLLIQVGVGNDQAARLVAAGGGLRVSYENSTTPGGKGRIVAICPVAGCNTGAPEYWMVPKVVISNQEKPALNDKGFIQLSGGINLAERATDGGPSANAAIKLIAPMSIAESAIHSESFGFNSSGSTIYQYFRILELGISRYIADRPAGDSIDYALSGGELLPSRIGLSFPEGRVAGLEPYAIKPDAGRALVYYNGIVQVDETTGSRNRLSTNDIASVAYVAYPGALGNGTNLVLDNSSILPGRSFGFNSNSNPSGFTVPQVSNSSGNNLSSQVLAALPPAAGGTPATPNLGNNLSNNSGNGELVASVSTIEGRAGSFGGVACPGRARQVVGRSPGDEADVGSTTALRGAANSVFQTTYALGEVSAELATADSGQISGAKRADTCL